MRAPAATSMSPRATTQTGSSSQTSISDAELEKLLNREASAFQRELEVNRILKAFKLKYVLAGGVLQSFQLTL